MSKQNFVLELKKAAGSVAELVIPVGKPVEVFLRPVGTNEKTINVSDVHLLSIWRNRFVKSFLTEFHSHDERTANWLIHSVAGDPGKILFMIDTLKGETIGHIGLGFINWQSGYVEADAIVRGKDARKGLMKTALQYLLNWARESLGLHTAWVRVRSDNPAVAFYQKTGFVEKKRVPLSVKDEPGLRTWYEDKTAAANAPALVYMQYTYPATNH